MSECRIPPPLLLSCFPVGVISFDFPLFRPLPFSPTASTCSVLIFRFLSVSVVLGVSGGFGAFLVKSRRGRGVCVCAEGEGV